MISLGHGVAKDGPNEKVEEGQAGLTKSTCLPGVIETLQYIDISNTLVHKIHARSFSHE